VFVLRTNAEEKIIEVVALKNRVKDLRGDFRLNSFPYSFENQAYIDLNGELQTYCKFPGGSCQVVGGKLFDSSESKMYGYCIQCSRIHKKALVILQLSRGALSSPIILRIFTNN
jgi:hypothetical protein